MLVTDAQRRLIGEFLRNHRERLTYAEAGLGAGSVRRRTPGLRREEVAQLCGMSPTWYSWIEQGRDISVSPSALARLAEALRLNGAERAYLFELASKRDPVKQAARPDPPNDPVPILQPAVDAVLGPAYALDEAWHAQAWNGAAARLFADWLGGSELCLLAYVFLDERARSFIPDWHERARRLVAEFRADLGRDPGSPKLRSLVERLESSSRDFAAFWNDHAVLGRDGGMRLFNHPEDGRVGYEQITLIPAGWPSHKLVMLVRAAQADARDAPVRTGRADSWAG